MLNKFKPFQFLLVLVLFVAAMPAIYAANPGSSGNYSSLNASVQSTASGGTIALDKDYVYDNVADTNFSSTGIAVSKDLYIDGNGHTIDAQGSTRVFNVANNAKLTLQNLIIKNTVNTAIYMGTGSTLNLYNCTFINNTGTYSSVYMPNRGSNTLNIDNSTFINGSGSYAIRTGSYNKNTVVTNSNFINNTDTAPQGTTGGIFNIMTGGSLILNNSKFFNNSGSDGACIFNSGNIVVTNCSFINNTASIMGAALRANAGSLTAINCTFLNNTSTSTDPSRGGGAIYGDATIIGCNFINNSAMEQGGAILGDMSISNSTFIGNSAGSGGAISGSETVTNSIFCNNVASQGSAIYNTGTLVANNNWWGTNNPDFSSLIYNSTAPTSWIYMNLSANNVPTYLNCTDKVNVTANFNYITDGVNISPITDGTYIPDGLTVYFQTDNGQITPNITTLNGIATAQYSYCGTGTNITANITANPTSNNFTDVNNCQTVKLNFLTRDTTPPTASADPIGGLYNTKEQIILKMSENGKIYYTIDGTDPTTGSTAYTAPITIDSNTTLKYLAVDLAGNPSSIYTEIYTIDTLPPVVSSNLVSGIYNTNKSVVLSLSEPGTIYYTLNGTDPTISGSKYTNPLVMSATTTLKYFAVDLAGNPSPIYSMLYTIDTKAPSVVNNVNNGLYNVTKTVVLKMSELGTIYYTLNGTAPTISISKYTKPLIMSATTTLKYFAVDLAGNKSPIYTQKYTIDKTAPKVIKITPKNNAGNVSLTKPITVNFSENIYTGINYNKIYIKNIKTGKKLTISKSVKNNVLYIKTSKKLANSWYQIYIPSSSIKDNAGNNIKNYSIKFKTGKK